MFSKISRSIFCLLLVAATIHAESYDRYSKKLWTNNFPVPEKDRIFFESNIGMGFLYFAGITANFAALPPAFFGSLTTAPIKGRLKYNRTPLYEYILGYQPTPYFKFGVSYQHQGGVSVQTKLVSNMQSNELARSLFSANLELDAVMFKIYGDTPRLAKYRNTELNAYLGFAMGPGWQSWTNIQMLRTSLGSVFETGVQTTRQKLTPTVSWTVDVGARGKGVYKLGTFSLLAGLKFNYWGRSGSMGRASNQDSSIIGLLEPFKIRRVYQWAPYLGAEWDFPCQSFMATKHVRRLKSTSLIANLNVGVGILYFRKVRGNLISRPRRNEILNIPYTTAWDSSPVGNKLSYNRTPLFEYVLMHEFNEYVQLGLSYQNQGGVTVQSLPYISPNVALSGTYSQFIANLNLNALMVKGYFFFPQISLRRFVTLSPYAGFGFGPGWQSWSRAVVLRTVVVNQGLTGGYQPLKQKISANFTFSGDFGVRIGTANPYNPLTITAGCKYNFWGQARSMGLLTQQDNYKLGLQRPVTIKTVYQWAPYLGVDWNFPSTYTSKRPYYLEGYGVPTFKPRFVSISTIQKPKAFFTEFNVGLGLLYFSGVKGNLAEAPSVLFITLSKDVKIKGKLSYNRTPLFEYLFGYQFFPWLKTALSYQHQGNIHITTTPLHTFADNLLFPVIGSIFTNERNQFSADLNLDAIMAKVYFQSPKSIYWWNFVTTPYTAFGGGLSFQTWKRVQINEPFILLGLFDSFVIPIRQKFCTNMAFMWDLGVKMQSPYPDTGFSLTMGLKFNLWGQLRNLGKLSQSRNPRFGLFKPIGIKSIYQWAPYAGVQWNF